eukprot:878957-Heterocapsa_arctica.AAC.1
MNVNMIKGMVGVPWDAKGEGPRGRPPKERRDPAQTPPEAAPLGQAGEGQDAAVQAQPEDPAAVPAAGSGQVEAEPPAPAAAT